MEPTEIRSKLINLAANPKFREVFEDFTRRKRSRSNVNIRPLMNRLLKKGSALERKDVAQVLRSLADLGLAKPHESTRGKLFGIKDLKYSLKSIGTMALGSAVTLSPFTSRNKTQKLSPAVEKIWEADKDKKFIIGFKIKDKVITMDVPEEFDTQDILKIVRTFREINK